MNTGVDTMTSKIEKDDITKKEETKLKKALLIIRNILLLLSPLWVPFAYLGFFWLLEQLLPFKFMEQRIVSIFGMIFLWTTPFIATIPIIINKLIPTLLKVLVIPIYILFGGLVIVFSAWGACSEFIGHCY